MNREQRRALIKQARHERSRRIHNATAMREEAAAERIANHEALMHIRTPPVVNVDFRQPEITAMAAISEYMRLLGLGPIIVDVSREPKPATVVEPERLT